MLRRRPTHWRYPSPSAAASTARTSVNCWAAISAGPRGTVQWQEAAAVPDPATDEYALRDALLVRQRANEAGQARQAGLFTNAQELEKVQPEDVGAANIYAHRFTVGAEDVYRDFALELFGEGTKAAVVYVPLNSSFAVGVKPGGGVASRNTWGTPGIRRGPALVADEQPRDQGHLSDQDGKTHVDQDATERANVKAQDIPQPVPGLAVRGP